MGDQGGLYFGMDVWVCFLYLVLEYLGEGVVFWLSEVEDGDVDVVDLIGVVDCE